MTVAKAVAKQQGITCHELVDHQWQSRKLAHIDALPQKPARSSVRILHVPLDTFPDAERSAAQRSLSARYNVPSFFWASYRQNASGLFGCQEMRERDHDDLKSYDTWTIFLAKQVYGGGHDASHAYRWHYIKVFTSYTIEEGVFDILLVEGTPELLARIQALMLDDDGGAPSIKDPFAVYHALLEAVVEVFDRAVWDLRTWVRSLEKSRPGIFDPSPNYSALHDLARHAIHVSETLSVAIETMGSLVSAHDEYFLEQDHDPLVRCLTRREYLSCRRKLRQHLGMFKMFRHRSQAIEDRLKNELGLVFNVVAQHDSQLGVHLNRVALSEGAAMKTIAFLNLIFLPGTFVSAIFGMNFFNFEPPESSGFDNWQVSGKFWLYWAITIPLTAATVISWLVWQRRNRTSSSFALDAATSHVHESEAVKKLESSASSVDFENSRKPTDL